MTVHRIKSLRTKSIRVINKIIDVIYDKIRIKINPGFVIDEPTSNSIGYWGDYEQKILSEFRSYPENFLRQPTIRLTIHPNEQEVCYRALNILEQSNYFNKILFPFASDPPLGNPFRCANLPSASPLTIQHLFYLDDIHTNLGIDVLCRNDVQVVEFGAGYGNMCRLAHHAGFSGSWCIYDLPLMQTVQKSYLLKTSRVENIKFIDDISKVDNISGTVKVFVATYSLSEADFLTQNKVLSIIDEFDFIYITYQEKFKDQENTKYFQSLQNKLEASHSVELDRMKINRGMVLRAKRINL